MSKLTPSQTIGPFFHEGLKWAMDLTNAAPPSDALQVSGRMFDGMGELVTDALLEIWTPSINESVAPASPLSGFQRVATNAHGRFGFWIPAPAHSGPYASVTIFTRGLLREVFTRLYVAPASAPSALNLPKEIPENRRHTLIGRHSDVHPNRIEWDVHLRGENETVFFSFR